MILNWAKNQVKNWCRKMKGYLVEKMAEIERKQA